MPPASPTEVGGTTPVFRHLDVILDGVPRTGVIHVGAHKGQEVPAYRAAGFERIVLVEPNPAYWPTLEGFDAVVHRCAAGPQGHADLHITSWPQRSSLLRPVDYRVKRTIEVEVCPVYEMQEGCNVAALDIQGAELEALRTADLSLLDVVIVECFDERRYEGAAITAEVDEFMLQHGFVRFGEYGGHAKRTLVDVVWKKP